MNQRKPIILAVITVLILLIVIAWLAPSPDQKRIGTVSPLFVSPLGMEPRGYLPMIRCDDCPTPTITPTWVPTLPGDPTLMPTPTIPPTLPRMP